MQKIEINIINAESFKDGFVTGLSEDYIKVSVKADKSLLNNVVATKLIELKNDFVIGKVIN